MRRNLVRKRWRPVSEDLVSLTLGPSEPSRKIGRARIANELTECGDASACLC